MSSHIRITFENGPQQDPGATLDERVQVVTDAYYNREQEREAKAQEDEKKKQLGPAQMLMASRGTLRSPLKPLEVNQMGNAGFADSWGIGPKSV